MQRVFVMLLVAGPEHDRVEATEKAEHVQEKCVQPLCLKHGAVAQLVEAIQQKRIHRAVQEKQHQHGEDRPAIGNSEPRYRAGEHDDSEVAERLRKAERVAAPVQFGQQITINGCAIPVDFASHFGAGVGRAFHVPSTPEF